MEARLNVTYGGSNGDLVDMVDSSASDAELKLWAKEAIESGAVAGISATSNVDLSDFVVDRFSANADRGALIMIRAKTPFG